MKFEYPTDDNSSFLKGASNAMGFYPVGVLNNWHGGIHLEWGTRAIRSIADGYILACRLPSKAISKQKEEKEFRYSNGFILIYHRYVSPGGQKFNFYSFYNHLLPKEEYAESSKGIPLCFKDDEYEVSKEAKEKSGIRIWMNNKKDVKESFFIPQGYIVSVDTSKEAGCGGKFEEGEVYRWVKARDLKGTTFREGYIKMGKNYITLIEGNDYKVIYTGAKSQDDDLEVWKDKECTVMLCLLPSGSKVKVISHDKQLAEIAVGGKTGYVKKPDVNLIGQWASRIKTDEICKCVIPVKAGEIIGYSGPYGCAENPNYRTAHIEVFTDDKENLDKLLNNEWNEGKKMYVKVPDKLGALKYNFLSGTEVEILDNGDGNSDYVRIKVGCVHVKVNRKEDLGTFNKVDRSYSFDSVEKTTTLNKKLKNLLSSKGKITLVKEPKDQTEKEKSDKDVALSWNEREVSYASPLAGSRFWINKKDLTGMGEGGYTIGTRNISAPKVLEVDLYQQKPTEDKEKHDESSSVEHIVEISQLKEIVQSDNPEVKWYEVSPSNVDIDGNKCHEYFLKIENEEMFSAFEWGKFGFRLIGDNEDSDRYLYDISPQPENTLIGYVQSLVDQEQNGQKKNGVLEPREFDAVMRDRGKINKLSRLVCYHRNEWGYDSHLSGLMDEFVRCYDKMISEEKEEKYKQRLQEVKDVRLNEMEEKVKELCFWKDVAGKYEFLRKYEKKTSISPEYYEQMKVAKKFSVGTELAENNGHPEMTESTFITDTFNVPAEPHVYHFHPIAFVEQMKRMNVCYCVGDSGNVVREINFRLAGFGGVLPGDKFTSITEKGVKQFQRDYMGMSVPTGIVDDVTLQKIDEFSDLYREDVENYKCQCGKCTGFGSGQFKGEYHTGKPVSETYHKYEYPGIHQSLLWAVSASRFYLTIKLKNVYSINCVYSAYRCWADNKKNRRSSTNHMGKAVDIHFDKNGSRTTSSTDMDELREKIYCNCIGAPKNEVKEKCNFGWVTNRFGLESEKYGASSWVHLDVREFKTSLYLKDVYFIKSNYDENFNLKIYNLKN